jgi:16S rRNA (guanine527-N7)-methyltransferase
LSLPELDPLRLERFLEEVRAWAPRTNLVGSTDAAALRRHVEDSLAAAPLLKPAARVVDLGSGAGFPGIPLALARRDLRIALVEIRERRFHFLRRVVRSLELECEVLRQRIEDRPPRPYDYALLRAVAPPARSAQLARPWVHTGGEIWIWTSGGDPALERSCSAVPLRSGGCILRVPASGDALP